MLPAYLGSFIFVCCHKSGVIFWRANQLPCYNMGLFLESLICVYIFNTQRLIDFVCFVFCIWNLKFSFNKLNKISEFTSKLNCSWEWDTIWTLGFWFGLKLINELDLQVENTEWWGGGVQKHIFLRSDMLFSSHTLLFLHVGEVFEREGPHWRSPESIGLHDGLQASPGEEQRQRCVRTKK